MSAIAETIRRRAIDCAIDVCWRQWRAITATGTVPEDPAARSVIDPEALLLLTLAVREHERRLDDLLAWWAAAGSNLLSTQRTRVLAAAGSTVVGAGLAWFSSLAVEAGDPRWRVFAKGVRPADGGRPGKGPRELRLAEPATLMLRLRAGFGVGVKADLLALLIGTSGTLNAHGTWATADAIARATGYSVVSIRRAASDMVMAGLVSASQTRPAHYSVAVEDWARLLHLSPDVPVPAWQFWSQMASFLGSVIDLGSGATQMAPVVFASRGRDLVESCRQELAWNGIEPADPRRYPGDLYVEVLERVVADLATLADR